MRLNSVILGHPISTSFPQVDSWSTDPQVLGRHRSDLEFESQ